MREEEERPLEESLPSKSQVKREMLALQALGERLTTLSDKQLEQIPLQDERLRAAVVETRRINSRNARRRHLQFIGRLMRDVDPEPIETALERLFQPAREENERFHRLEQMRDELLAAGVNGVENVLAEWPQADRQQLRQLVLQHQREQQRGQPPTASRKLFRYLRDLAEDQGDS